MLRSDLTKENSNTGHIKWSRISHVTHRPQVPHCLLRAWKNCFLTELPVTEHNSIEYGYFLLSEEWHGTAHMLVFNKQMSYRHGYCPVEHHSWWCIAWYLQDMHCKPQALPIKDL